MSRASRRSPGRSRPERAGPGRGQANGGRPSRRTERRPAARHTRARASRVLRRHEVAHHAQRERHQRAGAHPHGARRRQQPRHRQQAGEPPGDRERLAVVVAQQRGPRVPEVARVARQLLGEQPAGLEPVVDALTVERVHAACGVTDQGPVRPRDARHRAAHRQERRPDGARLAVELPLLAAQVGVVRQQRAQVHVRRPPRGRERPDADVHLALAEREHPPVAAEQLPFRTAQLQMGGDPGSSARADFT